MSNEITMYQGASEQTALALKQREIDPSVWSAMKNSIYPGAKDDSVILALDYCKARNLDPLKKPVHIVSMYVTDSQTGQKGYRDVIMNGISEARTTAFRTGEYMGQDEPKFGPTVELQFGNTTHQVPEYCTVTVYRKMCGEKVGFSHTEYFEEAAGTTKEGELNKMWKTRKRGQLSKCAEAGALRKGFSEQLGGMMTSDEVEGGEQLSIPMNEQKAPAAPAVKTKVESPLAKKAKVAQEAQVVEKPSQVIVASDYPAQGEMRDNGDKTWSFRAYVKEFKKNEDRDVPVYKAKLRTEQGIMVVTTIDSFIGASIEDAGESEVVATIKAMPNVNKEYELTNLVILEPSTEMEVPL